MKFGLLAAELNTAHDLINFERQSIGSGAKRNSQLNDFNLKGSQLAAELNTYRDASSPGSIPIM